MLPGLSLASAPSLELSEFAALNLLALIQGLTEFLPISSSGHLVLTQHALEVGEAPLVVDVALHAGTLMAVLVHYRRDLLQLGRDLLAGRLREILQLFVATLPVVFIGLTFYEAVRERFLDPRSAAWGLVGTAVVLLVADRRRRSGAGQPVASEEGPEPMPWIAAIAMGCAQAVAVLPGVSRSGSTISAGLLCGVKAERAARFSFLLSIPAIVGACVKELPELVSAGAVDGPSPGALAWAVVFSAFVGWGALRVLLVVLERGAFLWFALYCLLLGAGYLLFA